MSGVEEVDFRLRHIVAISGSPGDGEGGVIFAPNDQGRRLHFAAAIFANADRMQRWSGSRGTAWPECRPGPDGTGMQIRRSTCPDRSARGADWIRHVAGASLRGTCSWP